MSKYCRFCGTMLADETIKCWDCGKDQERGGLLVPSPSQTVEPKTTAEPRSSEPPAQSQLGTAKTNGTAAGFRTASSVEKCEIIYENSGMSIRRFVAKVAGPNGVYEAARSRNLTGEALFDLLDDMAGEKYEGPSHLVQTNVEILLDLVARLMQAGWEPSKEEGEHWWSKKFIRQVESTHDAILPGSPIRWEPWFRSTSNRAFERKLAHVMGFDGKIQLFEIRTHDAALDALLNGRLFLDFQVDAPNGVFLRHVRAPEDWPQTTLMFLDLTNRRLSEVLRSDSSMLNWTVYRQTESELTLITEQRSNVSKGYTIRHKGGISFELFSSQ